MDRFSEVVPAERRLLYERLLDGAPRLLKRFEAGQPLTLIHGDAHWWNCFVPQDSHQAQVRLIDWEDWTIGAGTMDLAYMIAMLWFPERRRATEQPLLDCYHDTLLANGVAAYSRQMLDDDYRWSVVLQLLRPIWQATLNLPARVWWPNLERNFLAVEDLGCQELLA
jgi:thiamine kinase-like enzyme